MAKKITWGIIGCGDVTELKSGPAFNKVTNATLLAVMRRNLELAHDYASRHAVSEFYNDANRIIQHPSINAVYIATPPDTHEEYCLACLKAGKDVYVEKPMALNSSSAKKMMTAASRYKRKLVVAHYRRAQPKFVKIKQLLDGNHIGNVLFVKLAFRRQLLSSNELENPANAWRIDPEKSGGGLFHDLAPHQLGLMYYFFGEAAAATGFSGNRSGAYEADDLVCGNILFQSGVQFSGDWCFCAAPQQEKDYCKIFGSKGSIGFSIFGAQEVVLQKHDDISVMNFDVLPHVQQPLIEQTVQYFLGKRDNPCPPEEGVAIMKWMDAFTRKRK